ncbi:precorrin-3B C(17)-methyltransferase [Halalkalibacter urbisdiaboli]|uniref:precorrin-3B C(17)-methyltransferase n=1 Tax=Halalkalibacter urbisdiaboli TaxID=1960589 RepID=UPI000B43BCC0|nr:precorrin-3B C(17)-methyltransferase [Halalkalibacter urbisdiaboli]
MSQKGKLLIIGFGPGHEQHMTIRAKEAILESDSIIGYNTYVDLIRPLLTNQTIVRTGMTEEVSRAQEAVRQAEQGKKVAVISSGDAGVYGMAGLVYEVLIEKGWKEKTGVEVEIIPGVSAINSVGSLLGAPIMHDACTISLSDHLTPWELIKKRIDAAAQADFVIALYNPKSGRRTKQIEEAQRILLLHRSPDTPVGLVKSAYRDRQHIVMTKLSEMLEHEIGMLTTVIIGNGSTFMYDGKMITPRGYQRKYTLGTDKQPLKPHQRLREENEPWALHNGSEQEQAPQSLRSLAEEALGKLNVPAKPPKAIDKKEDLFKQEAIFEFAVSPGLANKKITSQQLLTIVQIIGEDGEVEYTTDHQLKVEMKTSNPSEVTAKLEEKGFMLHPVGDVVTIKACDFCDGDKGESIPQLNDIHELVGGEQVPKRLSIGFNGCGMACYGAPTNDIGVIYRKKGFDLFLGAKTTGRNAHVGQLVAEGMNGDELVRMVVKVVRDFQERGLPNERFHKFFKRVQVIEGYRFREVPDPIPVDMACGD